MNPVFVLDTNAVIHFFKGKGQVAERLRTTPASEIALTAITVYELERGVRKSPPGVDRRERLSRFLATVEALPFDSRAAQFAADIAARQESKGMPIGPLDTLIAAVALAHGATLVTHNTAEFSRISGLTVIDWY